MMRYRQKILKINFSKDDEVYESKLLNKWETLSQRFSFTN